MKKVLSLLSMVLVVGYLAGLWVPGEAVAAARNVRFIGTRNFGGGEFSTSLAVGTGGAAAGASLATRTFNVAGTAGLTRAVLITVGLVGDEHLGAARLLGCFVDGVACHSAASVTGSAGWTTVTRIPRVDPALTGGVEVTNCFNNSDCHDNSSYITYCMNLLTGSHTANIRLAVDNPAVSGKTAFVEEVFLLIEQVNSPLCQVNGVVSAPAGAEEAEEIAPPHN